MREFHTYRINGAGGTMDREISYRDAIVIHCCECFGFDARRDTRCTSRLCALFPFSPFGRGNRGGIWRLLGKGASKVALEFEGEEDGGDGEEIA